MMTPRRRRERRSRSCARRRTSSSVRRMPTSCTTRRAYQITELSAIPSSSAISCVFRPAPRRRRMSRSRGDSWSLTPRRPGNAFASDAPDGNALQDRRMLGPEITGRSGMAITKVGVVGFGQMGSGIAQVCASAGLDVVAREVDQKFIDNGMRRIDGSLARVVKSGRMSEDDAKAARGRIRGTTSLADLASCDLVIEAVIEVMEAKKEVWTELDRVCGPDTLFASNTSSLTIIEMAAATKRPDRF